MKKIKYYVSLVLLFICLFICTGCIEPQKPIVFSLEETDVELVVGDSYTPKLLIENIENYELEYSYNSDAIKIEDGVIYCLSESDCVISISIKNHEEVNSVILNLYIIEIVPTKIICNKEVTIFINESYKLEPTVEPDNATKLYTFSSSNSKVVEVTDEGEIKGISVGQTNVVIRSQLSNSIYTRVLVKVVEPPVESVESTDTLTINYDQTYQLEWNVMPSEANQDVIFQSSDSSIASVNDKGLITAHKYGTATIKIISLADESKYAEIVVKVDGDKATDINIETQTIDLELGSEFELVYSITPSTAYQGLEISVNDPTGIEVIGNTVCAKKVGSFEITLSTIDETDIKKIISINVKGDEKPIFVTNDIFGKQSILSWNEEFDPLDNIKAFDDKDGDITNQIVIKGEVDNKRYGEYTLEYFIQDSDGNSLKLVRAVEVIWGYDVTVIGHAGSYYGVPNSEEAILYAAEVLKYPAIEIDLKQTKDGVFVLSHDPQWGSAVLDQTNYDDLKNVEYTVTKNAGVVEGNLTEKERTYTAKICTFERYLEICKQYGIIAIIELKTSAGVSNWTEANAPKSSRMPQIMELIKKYDMLNKVVFLSSQELCLNWVKTNGYEYIPCQYLTLSSCESEKTYNIVKKYNLDISFNVRDGIKISDEWLQKYRDLGCKLAVFTFEEWASYNDIQTWIDRGVDFVTTDWHSLDKLELPKSE